MLANELKAEKATLKANGKFSAKRKMHDPVQRSTPLLKEASELLGFPANTTICVNTKTESPDKVEINRGLRYVEVSCDI